MKRINLLLIIVLLSSLSASAQTLIDGIYYNLIPKTKQAEVTTVSGHRYSGAVEIPSSVTYEDVEYTVTSVGTSAFLWCESLKSVVIPNSVKKIGDRAFYSCTSLINVTIGSGVTSIGADAFNGDLRISTVTISDFEAWCKIEFSSRASNPMCYGRYLYLDDKEITAPEIPDGVTSIGGFAFVGCTHFTSVTIPNTVTSIGEYAFERCSGLTAVSIPGSVTTIGNSAFYDCTGLTSITISNGVQTISRDAFRNCRGIVSLSIPNSVQSIESDAFAGCEGLTSVTFGNGLYTIGDYAFMGCINLASAKIPEGVDWIGQGAFSGCKAVSTVTLPSSLKELDPQAFAECPNLMEVYCYAEELPYTKRNAMNWESPYISDLFKDSYIESATLYVPESAIDAYKENETWNGFGTIKTLSGEGPEEQKCAAPAITYEGGILTFSCETEDVEYIYNMTPATAISGNGNNISAPTAYKVSVYATKSGYKDSDVVTKEITVGSGAAGIRGDVNGDGEIGMPDVMFIVNYILNGKFPDE